MVVGTECLPAGICASNWAAYVHSLHDPGLEAETLDEAEEEICSILCQVPELCEQSTKERFADATALVVVRNAEASTEPIYPRVKLPAQKVEELPFPGLPKPTPNRGGATAVQFAATITAEAVPEEDESCVAAAPTGGSACVGASPPSDPTLQSPSSFAAIYATTEAVAEPLATGTALAVDSMETDFSQLPLMGEFAVTSKFVGYQASSPEGSSQSDCTSGMRLTTPSYLDIDNTCETHVFSLFGGQSSFCGTPPLFHGTAPLLTSRQSDESAPKHPSRIECEGPANFTIAHPVHQLTDDAIHAGHPPCSHSTCSQITTDHRSAPAGGTPVRSTLGAELSCAETRCAFSYTSRAVTASSSPSWRTPCAVHAETSCIGVSTEAMLAPKPWAACLNCTPANGASSAALQGSILSKPNGIALPSRGPNELTEILPHHRTACACRSLACTDGLKQLPGTESAPLKPLPTTSEVVTYDSLCSEAIRGAGVSQQWHIEHLQRLHAVRQSEQIPAQHTHAKVQANAQSKARCQDEHAQAIAQAQQLKPRANHPLQPPETQLSLQHCVVPHGQAMPAPPCIALQQVAFMIPGRLPTSDGHFVDHHSCSVPTTDSASATVCASSAADMLCQAPDGIIGSGGALADASGRLSKDFSTMSPKTRTLYKAFSHQLRSKDAQGKGMIHALALAKRCMSELPTTVHWRVHLELADLAKREQAFLEARGFFRKAAAMQPAAAQTWLEYAKMEEERGHFQRCQRILAAGLFYCPCNEALMLKSIKHLERMGQLMTARTLLSKLGHLPISQTWRMLLEGALLEARASQTLTARRIFKFLLHQAPWYGPIWHEACRFEQRCNHVREALRIAELGLVHMPRYGPLWFCALRLCESTSTSHDLVRSTRALVQRGVNHISKDLVWKLWFECAQVEERSGHLTHARSAYVCSVASCAVNLRWKVWLGGARTELNHNQFDVAQRLLERAREDSPSKMRALVMLEQSRLHELRGNADVSRKLLRDARRTNCQEWKVFLESILLELRAQSEDRAIREARISLNMHRGTGRLWAVLIQLEHARGIERQLAVFQRALLEVPKSGEVWCEGARICLNPFSPCFNLDAACIFLDFAIEFTPQYGDSFIEYLRLQILTRACKTKVERLWQLCINAEPNYGTLWFHYKGNPLLSTRQVLDTASAMLHAECRELHLVYEAAIMRAKTQSFQAAVREAACSVLRSPDQTARFALPTLPLDCCTAVVPADLVTGSVQLNRLQRHFATLSTEEQRCIIYGGDVISP